MTTRSELIAEARAKLAGDWLDFNSLLRLARGLVDELQLADIALAEQLMPMGAAVTVAEIAFVPPLPAAVIIAEAKHDLLTSPNSYAIISAETLRALVALAEQPRLPEMTFRQRR